MRPRLLAPILASGYEPWCDSASIVFDFNFPGFSLASYLVRQPCEWFSPFMPQTRRQQWATLDLLAELPGVKYLSDSSCASSPLPEPTGPFADMIHLRRPSACSRQSSAAPPPTPESSNGPSTLHVTAPAGPSAPSFSPQTASVMMPAMTMEQLSYMVQTIGAVCSVRPCSGSRSRTRTRSSSSCSACAYCCCARLQAFLGSVSQGNLT